MKDIGYYAGFLKAETQEQITKADLPKLALSLEYLASEFSESYYYNNEEVIGCILPAISETELSKLGTRDRLAVIRGLCDRIELKLMEQAN